MNKTYRRIAQLTWIANKIKKHLMEKNNNWTQTHKSMRMFYILTSSPTL